MMPFFFFFIISIVSTAGFAPSRAPLNSIWTPENRENPDGAILFEETRVLFTGHAFGFETTCFSNSSYYLSIFSTSFTTDCSSTLSVWQANRDFPVTINATLAFEGNGNLVLRQGDLQVWSSNTSNRGVAAMELARGGYLVLVGEDGEAIWQSSDHPTDTLLVDQPFRRGSKLVSSVSSTNRSRGRFVLELQSHALVAFAQDSMDSQIYVSWDLGSAAEVAYVIIRSCYLIAYDGTGTVLASKKITSLFCLVTGKFLRLQQDGDLRFYKSNSRNYSLVSTGLIGECGTYAISRQSGCACLDFDPLLTLQPLDAAIPDSGCSSRSGKVSLPDTDRCNSESTAASSSREKILNSVQNKLLEARGYDYIPLQFMRGKSNLSVSDCKKLCLSSCSCAAAFVHMFGIGDSVCYHVDALYTVASEPLRAGYASAMFLKIRVPPGSALPAARKRSGKTLSIVANTAIGGFSVIILASVVIAVVIFRWKRRMARVSAVEN